MSCLKYTWSGVSPFYGSLCASGCLLAMQKLFNFLWSLSLLGCFAKKRMPIAVYWGAACPPLLLIFKYGSFSLPCCKLSFYWQLWFPSFILALLCLHFWLSFSFHQNWAFYITSHSYSESQMLSLPWSWRLLLQADILNFILWSWCFPSWAATLHSSGFAKWSLWN